MNTIQKPSKFATIHKSGAVTVDLAAYFRSPKGREELRKFSEFTKRIKELRTSRNYKPL